MKKKLLFSVTRNDFEIQSFTVPGHGGGGKDTSNSGIRLKHIPSGATATGTKHRTNSQNRKDAFLKLIESKEFKKWHKLECAKRMGKQPEESEDDIMRRVDRMIEQGLKDGSIKVEEI